MAIQSIEELFVFATFVECVNIFTNTGNPILEKEQYSLFTVLIIVMLTSVITVTFNHNLLYVTSFSEVF